MRISHPVELRSTGRPRGAVPAWHLLDGGTGDGRLPGGPLTIGCAGSQNSIPLSAILLKGYRSNWQAADGLALPPGLGRIQVGKSSFYRNHRFTGTKATRAAYKRMRAAEWLPISTVQ